MASPGVTLTYKLTDPSGAGVQGKVVLTLDNFGTVIPGISGTGILANLQYPSYAAADGTGSVTIWGNYQLTNATNSFYQVSVYGVDQNGAISNAANVNASYRFNGTGTFALDALSPITSVQSSYSGQPVLLNPSGVQTIGTYALSVPGLQINGVAVPLPTNVPSAGQVPVAQSGIASAWQTLASTQNLINVQSYGVGVGAAKGVRLAATISSGSANLSITAGTKITFSNGDVGQNIVVQGSSGQPNFYTTIKTFTDSRHVVLNANAPANYTNVTAVWSVAGQGTVDRQALEAASTAQDTESGILYSPEAFYLYDQTPSLDTTKTKGLIGDGIRSTFWVAESASAGSFLNMTIWPRWTRFEKMSIYGPGFVAPSLITNVALTSNVATITASNGFASGQTIITQLLATTNGKLLNHQVGTVNSSGLSGSSFAFNYTHADISSTADTGIAYQLGGAIVTGSGGAWYQKISEVEIYNFPVGIPASKLIFPTWDRVWIHNCGVPYTIYVTPPTSVACTGAVMTAVYAASSYCAPILYYVQEGAWNGCYSESNGGGWILDFCEGMTFNGCAVEQPVYQNATVPGKFVELRTCRACTWNGGFLIQDSGGNAAQTFIALNTNGTTGSACQHNKFIGTYLTTSGNTPTYVVAFEDSTVLYNKVDEPYWTNGNFTTTFLDNTTPNANNSFIYKGDELSQGLHTTKISSNGGQAALTAVTPTAATAGVNHNSPDIIVSATYWDGAASQTDKLKIRAIPDSSSASNPLMDLDFGHVGSSGGFQITVSGTAAISSTGQWIGQINSSKSAVISTLACTTIAASALVSANLGLTVSGAAFTVASGQKAVLPTPTVTNSPAVTGTNWAFSAAWGNTAVQTVQASAFNAAGRVNVACGGTGIVANPTMTFTFTSDTNANTPILLLQDESPSTSDAPIWSITTIDTSHAVITLKGTPTTGRTYGFAWHMVFRG